MANNRLTCESRILSQRSLVRCLIQEAASGIDLVMFHCAAKEPTPQKRSFAPSIAMRGWRARAFAGSNGEQLDGERVSVLAGLPR